MTLMTPILTIKLQKIQPKPKGDNVKGNREKAGKMKNPPNPNEFIPSEVFLDDDHPEKKGEQPGASPGSSTANASTAGKFSLKIHIWHIGTKPCSF